MTFTAAAGSCAIAVVECNDTMQTSSSTESLLALAFLAVVFISAIVIARRRQSAQSRRPKQPSSASGEPAVAALRTPHPTSQTRTTPTPTHTEEEERSRYRREGRSGCALAPLPPFTVSLLVSRVM
jgi:hypothetical protein